MTQRSSCRQPITVFPGPINSRVSLVTLETPLFEAGNMLEALLTPLDAFGNALGSKSQTLDKITATAAAQDFSLETPLDVNFRPDLGDFVISGALVVAGDYSLKVSKMP